MQSRCCGLLSLILLVGAEPLTAQNSLSGSVRDQDDNPVSYCNTFVRKNGLVKKLASTDERGSFRLENLDSGSYEFVATAIGYKKYIQTVELNGTEAKLDIVLLADTVVLDQVIVHADPPIRIKGDTVVFDAEYFKRGDEVALSDLLKKLPGLSVGDDGKVKFQGKQVSRIKIENDDLFESNYHLLTKNLPAAWVEQVEVLQNYSNNPLLKDIEESDEVALNLTLNETHKNRLIGDFRGGTNLSARHEGRFNLASLKPRTKWYALSSANTLGEDPAGSVEELLSPSPLGGTLAGDGVASSFLVPVVKPYIPEFRKDRYYNNQAAFGSLQGLHKFSQLLTLKLVGYVYRDAADFRQVSRSDYYTPYDTVRFNELAATTNNESLWHFAGDVKWQATENLTFQYKARSEGMSAATGLKSNFNQQEIRDRLNASATLQDHALTVTWRHAEKSVLLGHLRLLSDSRPQEYRVDGNMLKAYFSTSSPSDTLFQVNSSNTRFFGGDAQWYLRTNRGRLGVWARLTFGSQQLTSLLTSAAATLSDNDLEYRKREVGGEAYYSWYRGRWVLTPAVKIQQVDVSMNDRPGGGTAFFLPRISIKWKGTESSFTFLYGHIGEVSGPYQLTRNPLMRRYNSLAIQDAGFRTFNQRTLLATYQCGGLGSGFSLISSLYHQDSPAAYLADLDVEPNYTVTTTDRIADRSVTSLSLEVDKYFTPIYSNLKLKWMGNRSRFPTSVEAVIASAISTSHLLDVSLRTAVPGPLNFHGGHIWQISATSSSLLSTTNYTSLLFLDTYMKGLQQQLIVTLHWERYEIVSFSGSPTFHFADVSVNWKIREGLEVYVKGRNLLDETTYAQRAISTQNAVQIVNSLINRYVLIGLQLQL